MRLKIASYKALKYSSLNFHYAKRVPVNRIAYSVFNDSSEWCGCISFGGGAGAFLGKPYNLVQGEFLELTRMALNGKQESTSKAMSIAIKLVKKNNPSVKLLISYADKKQNHFGVIYQATNWIYVGSSKSSGTEVFYKNKWVHNRMSSQVSKEYYDKLSKRKKFGKRKYLYPLNKSIRKQICKLSKPYPKKNCLSGVTGSTSSFQDEGGGAVPTASLNNYV